MWCLSCADKKYEELKIEVSRRCNTLKKCLECEKKQPAFGYDGNKNIWCRPCSLKKYNEMGIEESRRCDAYTKCEECHGPRAGYGYDDNDALWCFSCANNKYIELKIDLDRRCDRLNKCKECNQKTPMFGYDSNKYIWCSPCSKKKYEEMNIEESRQCDAFKKCQECKKPHPGYGYNGNKYIWCSPCSKKKYKELKIPLISQCNAKKMCIECNNTCATYGYDENKFMWCYPCSNKKYKELDIELGRRCNTIKICKGNLSTQCETTIHSSSQYQGYCVRCFQYFFPDETVSKNFRTKEKTWCDYIREKFPKYDWLFNKQIGSSKYRPDAILDMGKYIILLEHDENQHNKSGYSCENLRVMAIMNELGLRPIVIIRFNPDSYIDKNHKKIVSCWTLGKDNVVRINPTKQKEYQERLDIFGNVVKHYIENEPTKEVEEIKLFYDEV
jgi:hypothetical protein